MDILGDVMDGIGPRPDLIRANMAPRCIRNLLRCCARKLYRHKANDVERTFSLTEGAFYGAKYSIRPDAILRRDDGTSPRSTT